MTDETPQWVAHIDQANRLYFTKEEPQKPRAIDCEYFQSDACDCHGECMYGKIKEE